MKSINEYINEHITTNQGRVFKETVKFSLSDWNEWKKTIEKDYSKDIVVYEDTEEGLYFVYMNTKPLKHIATYKIDDEELWTDDTSLFGHEK